MKRVKIIPAPVVPRNKNDEVNLSDAELGAMLEYGARRDIALLKDDNAKKVFEFRD